MSYLCLSLVPYSEHDKIDGTNPRTWHLKLQHRFIDLKIPVNPATTYSKEDMEDIPNRRNTKSFAFKYQDGAFHLQFGFRTKCIFAPWDSSAFDKGYYYKDKWHMEGSYCFNKLSDAGFKLDRELQQHCTREIIVDYAFPQIMYHFLYSDGSEENALQPNMNKVVVAMNVSDIPKVMTEAILVHFYPVRLMYAPKWFHWSKLLCRLWCLLNPKSDKRQVEWNSKRELGNSVGSWKGGTLGASWPIRKGQTPEEAIKEWASQDLYELYSR